MKGLWQGLQTLSSLTPTQRRMLSEAWWGLLWFKFLLAFLPQSRLRSLVGERERSCRRRSRDGHEEEEGPELARWVEVAARHHLISTTCLVRSLCLYRMMSRRGCEARLRFGVRREDDADRPLVAHAWVEDGHGRPVGSPRVADGFGTLEILSEAPR